VSWIWDLLAAHFSLTLQGWAWVIFWFIVILATQSLLRDAQRRMAIEPTAIPEWPQLDSLEYSVMRTLAQIDGQFILPSDLAMRLQVSNLRLGKALESLESIDLIAPTHNIIDRTKVALTSLGRDFLLENGLVQ
jgi:DNA-binding MarR family transcriptional regulator